MAHPDIIQIRIRRDGTVYFSSLPAELLEVALALSPADPLMLRRFAALEQTRGRDGHQQEEHHHEHDSAIP